MGASLRVLWGRCVHILAHSSQGSSCSKCEGTTGDRRGRGMCTGQECSGSLSLLEAAGLPHQTRLWQHKYMMILKHLLLNPTGEHVSPPSWLSKTRRVKWPPRPVYVIITSYNQRGVFLDPKWLVWNAKKKKNSYKKVAIFTIRRFPPSAEALKLLNSQM